MIGTLILGGANYTLRQYLAVAAIITGTIIVSTGGGEKSSKKTEDSTMGLAFIMLSLACDGLNGGIQVGR